MRPPQGNKPRIRLLTLRSGYYNESEVRFDFIDPPFELLCWDVYNRQWRPEAYWDVIHEDRGQSWGRY